MIKVIETHIVYEPNPTIYSYDTPNAILDHESIVVEVDNWESYIEIFTKYNPKENPIYPNSCVDDEDGQHRQATLMPMHATIIDLRYDDYHLKCDFLSCSGVRYARLAYRI